MDIEWKTLSLKRNKSNSVFKNKMTDIILDSNGYAHKNQITAVISFDDEEIQSFMSLLCGEIGNNEWTRGIIKADGKDREVKDWIKDSIFCKKTGIFLDYLTVNDALKHCILFRDGHNFPLEKFEEILRQFKLFKIRYYKIQKLREAEIDRLFLARIYILEQKVVFLTNIFKNSLSNKRKRRLFCKIIKQISCTKTVFMGFNQLKKETYDIIDSIVILNKGRTIFSGTKESYLDFFKEYNIKLSRKKIYNLGFLSQIPEQNSEETKIDSKKPNCEIENDDLIDKMAEYTKIQFQNTESTNWKIKSKSIYDFSFNKHQIFNLMKEFKNTFYRMGHFARKTIVVFISLLPFLIYFENTIFPIINETIRHNINIQTIFEINNPLDDYKYRSYNILMDQYYKLIVEISWNAIVYTILCSIFQFFVILDYIFIISEHYFSMEDIKQGLYSVGSLFFAFFSYYLSTYFFLFLFLVFFLFKLYNLRIFFDAIMFSVLAPISYFSFYIFILLLVITVIKFWNTLLTGICIGLSICAMIYLIPFCSVFYHTSNTSNEVSRMISYCFLQAVPSYHLYMIFLKSLIYYKWEGSYQVVIENTILSFFNPKIYENIKNYNAIGDICFGFGLVNLFLLIIVYMIANAFLLSLILKRNIRLKLE